jgi:hypothetical protein
MLQCFIAAALFVLPVSAQQPTPQPSTVAAPAPATPAAQPLLTHVNKALPAWLKFSGEYRMRVEGFDGGGFKPDTRDGYALNRCATEHARSSHVLDAVSNPVAGRSGILEKHKARRPTVRKHHGHPSGIRRVWQGRSPNGVAPSWRQELVFGEMRLIGHLNWTNTARSFDAARLTLQRGKFKVDLFSAAVVNLREGTADKSSGGNDIHGAYGSITKVVPNATIEPYMLWRLARGTKTELGLPGKTDRKVYGVRFVGKLPANFDYNIETVGQTGSVGSDDVRAYASHAVLGYTLTSFKKKPRVFAEYNYASGDETPGDGVQQTFDQLYPTGHDKLGLSDQVGWKNIHDLRGGVEYKATGKLTLSGSYHSWWLASPRTRCTTPPELQL